MYLRFLLFSVLLLYIIVFYFKHLSIPFCEVYPFFISFKEKLYILPTKSIKKACRTDSLKTRLTVNVNHTCPSFVIVKIRTEQKFNGFSIQFERVDRFQQNTSKVLTYFYRDIKQFYSNASIYYLSSFHRMTVISFETCKS